MAIVLFAIIGAHINAGVGYWICLVSIVFSLLFEQLRRLLRKEVGNYD